MVGKKSSFVVILMLIAVLSACSGTAASEKIYNHLEKAVELEQSFEEQQDAIVELEQEEQDIYSQVIDLSMKEFDKIKDLSDKALDNIETRKEKIELEQESIKASKEEFVNIEDMIDDLEEKAAGNKADDMYSAMMDRYDAYDKLNEAYVSSLKLEKELYTMLKKEDLEQKTLSEHIEKLNGSYQKVIDNNKTFNERTETYNDLKKEFYDAAGMEVEYQKNKTKTKQDSDTDKGDEKEGSNTNKDGE